MLANATLTFALLTTLSAGVLSAPAHAHSAIEAGVDASIRPGDDFFAYANGGWLKATEIPEGSPRWNARNEINDLTRRQVEQLIDDAATRARRVRRAQGGGFPRGLPERGRHRGAGLRSRQAVTRAHQRRAGQGSTVPTVGQ